METMKELLGSHPFFAGLSPSAVELIAGCASNVHFAEGDRIFDEGEPASLFYVIRHGRVALEMHSPTKGPLVIDTVDEGEVLGWSWLVPPYRYFAGARAVTPVSATALDGACLRGKCEADAELGYQLVKRVTIVMYHRQQSARSRLLELYGWLGPAVLALDRAPSGHGSAVVCLCPPGRTLTMTFCSVDQWSVSSPCAGIRIGRSASCQVSGTDAIVRYHPVSP